MPNTVFGKWHKLCIIILQLCFLNFLWVIFSLLGLGLLGVGPATIALLTVIRQIIRSKDEIPVFSTFLVTFRKHFLVGNLLFLIYFLTGYVLYINLLYVDHYLLEIMFVFATFLYFISLTYVFPIMVHYDWQGMGQKIKYSLIFGVSHLHYTLVLFVVLYGVYFLLNFNLGLFTFFGVSIGGYLIMWFTHQVFLKVEDHFQAQVGACEETTISGR